ncbi:MAG: GerAB/ArcD/ProY family transporter [Clostridia bacterium]|nr:GerAB/ArcD/ProY family transporter [Clostridia bacterium]
MKHVQRIPAPDKSKNIALINTRQLCFLTAFILPVSKLLETPSLFAKNALGDLLLPAFLQFLLQFIGLFALLFITEKTGKSIFQLIEEKLGGIALKVFCSLLAVYYLFFALLPLLDAEKFIHAVFYDTAPSRFTFTPFFFLSAFACVKSLRHFSRMADLCLPLFLISFVGIIFMSAGESDFEALLPWFEFPASKIVSAVKNTTAHFSDALLLLPFLGSSDYQKGDGKKISAAFWLGAFFVFVFLAVFYGIYTTLAPRQHYAFSKVAQYFSALKTVGRVDLLLVYLLTAILLLSTLLPILLSVFCLRTVFGEKFSMVLSIVINGGLFAFVLYCNKYYNFLYGLFTDRLWWIFPAFSVGIPLFCLLLLIGNRKGGKPRQKGKKLKQGVGYAR